MIAGHEMDLVDGFLNSQEKDKRVSDRRAVEEREEKKERSEVGFGVERKKVG